MRHKKYLFAAASALSLSLLLFTLDAGAQCPGPTQRTALLNLQRANVVESTRAGQVALTDTCGNQRYAQYVEINLDTIAYTPTTTGNTSNLSEFVFDPSGALWYIDWQGNAVQFAAGGGSCDQDWLEIGPASCPDNINDSIYTYKYAAVGARYVWPGATFLVNDSTNLDGALMVVQGDRQVKIALYDITNESFGMLHQNSNTTSVLVQQDGSFLVSTVSGAPDSVTLEVSHLSVNTVDSTIQFYQYPNTRRDTQAVANFLYTDDFGVVRSQDVGVLPDQNGIYGGSGTIPDSTSAEVTFGGFFQIAYPTGVFDPAIRVTDNPPTTSRQIDLNSTNVNLKVYPNNVSIEAQDGINMLSNDGSDLEATFFMSPYSVGFSLDSTSTAGWTRVYSADEFSEMQATDGGPGGVATIRTYKSTPGGPPNILNSVTYSGATYPSNTVFIDTTGVKIQTFGTYGATGQVLRNSGGYLVWSDTTAGGGVNIYNSNGTISSNRTATLSDTILWDIASAAGAFQIEGLNNSAFRQSDNAINMETGGASLNLGSGTPVAMSLSLDAGTAHITDTRVTKTGIEYGSAGYGSGFTDSTLVHRRYVAQMIGDSLPATVGDILQNGNSFGAAMTIGTNDNNALNLEVNGTTGVTVGTDYAVTATASVAATNTVTDRLIIQTNSTGTPGNSFGGSILFQNETSTTNNRDAIRLQSFALNNTDATRTYQLRVQGVNNAGAFTEYLRVGPTAAAIGPTLQIGGGNTTYDNTGITTASTYTIGNSSSQLTLGGSTGSTSIFSISGTGNNVVIYPGANTASATGTVSLGNATAYTQTSSTRNIFTMDAGFAPTSGTAVHNSIAFTGTFNQTGGASGISRSIHLNQTLTAVADFRGIEIAYSNANAKGIYQTGASTTNNFVGGTMFGSTSAPSAVAAIEVSSTTKGILFPRMTTTERNAISAVAGLAIFNTTTTKLEVYDGATWQACW